MVTYREKLPDWEVKGIGIAVLKNCMVQKRNINNEHIIMEIAKDEINDTYYTNITGPQL